MGVKIAEKQESGILNIHTVQLNYNFTVSCMAHAWFHMKIAVVSCSSLGVQCYSVAVKL